MIRLEHVSRRFETASGAVTTALADVSLEAGPGEFVALVGRSGCGKSTLLRLIAGLIAPSEGRVTRDGREVTGPDGQCGIVFQAPTLLPWASVLDNVLFPVSLRRRPDPADRARAASLLATVGLEGFEGHVPQELSGGMQQRVAICRALMHDPALLLMDEPFAALDALTRDEMCLELGRILLSARKTVFFVTHNVPEAVLLADRVVVLAARPGRVIADIAIEVPRPRTLEHEGTAVFQSHVQTIRGHLGVGRRAAA